MLLLAYYANNYASIIDSGLIRTCGVSFDKHIKEDKDGFDFTSLVANDKKKLWNKLLSKFGTCQPPVYIFTSFNTNNGGM